MRLALGVGHQVTLSLLLVEDDDGIALPLATALAREGYVVERVADGESAVERLRTSSPAIMVLDLGLPDMDGLDVCRIAGEEGLDTQILILTARGDELDRVVGLDAGADDYLAKPFALAELLARVRVLGRRAAAAVPDGAGPDPVTTGLRIDTRTRRVFVGATEVHLSTKAFDVLAVLNRESGVVVTRGQLMDEVWDEHWFGSTKTLDVTIGRLRQKLMEHMAPAQVVAVRGVGFRLELAGA